MNLFRAAAFTLTFALAPLTMAQSPAFFMDEAVPLGPTGSQISFNLQSVPGTLCAVSLDLDGTPSTFFAEEICLGMSPALTTVLVASIPPSGTVLGSLTVPALPAIADIPLFGQGVVFHPAAPNGQFVTSNGESSVVHTGTVAIVDRFDNAAMAGFTGGFRTDVLGRLRGGDVTRRVHSTVAPQSVLFNLGIASPFGYEGVREQMVYRPVDLGASSARVQRQPRRDCIPIP